MKFAAFLALTISGASAFAPSMGARSATSLDGAIVYFSTSTRAPGDIQIVSHYIAEAAGGLDVMDIGDAYLDDIMSFDGLIIGAPAWNTGAYEQRSETSLDNFLLGGLPYMDIEGKTVAVFGMGDQERYGDNFCDAAGELYDHFKAKGCKMLGLTSTDGYSHTGSKAERDGKFVGLMMDEENQYDLSEARAKAWVEQLKSEGFAF